MISYIPIDPDEAEGCLTPLADTLEEQECEEMYRAVEFYLSNAEQDEDIAACVTDGCLSLRICDMGRYSFVFPIPLSGQGDISSALRAISEYAVREELYLVFADVPAEDMGLLFGSFRHLNCDASDPYSESYSVRVISECYLLDEFPSEQGERVTLDRPTPEDASAMAALARDGGVNRYWGYDYLSDVGEVADSYFYDTADQDFERGFAISHAVRLDGEYIGEATLYGFDLFGGAQIAVRLLPGYHGKGLGSEALGLLLRVAERIGLTKLYASVMEQNAPSLRFTSAVMRECGRENGIVRFEYDLTEIEN